MRSVTSVIEFIITSVFCLVRLRLLLTARRHLNDGVHIIIGTLCRFHHDFIVYSGKKLFGLKFSHMGQWRDALRRQVLDAGAPDAQQLNGA